VEPSTTPTTLKSSILKVETNRANALKSTGPRTARGKNQVRRNAVSHGLLASSKNVLLPGEDKKVFNVFMQGLLRDLAPVGDMEALLVERIVSSAWRLRRILRIELGILATENSEARRETMLSWNPFKSESPLGTGIEPMDEMKLIAIGMAFKRDASGGDALGKLRRYESAIERSLYRALHELQRLQEKRSGKDVPVPAAIDIDVSVLSGHVEQ